MLVHVYGLLPLCLKLSQVLYLGKGIIKIKRVLLNLYLSKARQVMPEEPHQKPITAQ